MPSFSSWRLSGPFLTTLLFLMVLAAAACNAAPSPIPGPTGTTAPAMTPSKTREITPADLSEVRMIDPLHGWAIGGEDAYLVRVMITDDGGKSWQDRSPISGQAQSQGEQVTANYFNSTSESWIITQPFEILSSNSDVGVWRTTDSGSTWELGQTLNPGEMTDYYIPINLQFTTAGRGWLLGNVGAGMSHEYVSLHSSVDLGNHWQLVADPISAPEIQGCQKTGMHFNDDQVGWITADCLGIVPGALFYQSVDGGQNWAEIGLPPPPSNQNLFDESNCSTSVPHLFPSDGGILLVNCLAGEPKTVPKSFLYRTDDAGQTWEAYDFPGGELHVLGENLFWAAGDQIFRSTDGGDSWQQSGTAPFEAGFSFVDELTGWALDINGTLASTSDGGQTWDIFTPVIKSN